MGVKKCPICGQVIQETDDTIPFKSRTAHRRCLNNVVHAQETEKKKPPKKIPPKSHIEIQPTVSIPVSEAEYKEKRAVIEYIEQLTNTKATAKTYKLLEDYSKKYKFSFQGMLKGLQYYFEVLEHPIEGDCIGIIPYIYDEAQEYMGHIEESAQANKKFTSEDIEAMYPFVKVQITRKKDKPQLIDIASLQ
jgi:hypothetical protein